MAPKAVKSRTKSSPRLRSGQALRRDSARALRQGPPRLRSGQAGRSQKNARVKANRTARVPKVKPLGKREIAEFRRQLEDERTRLLAELEAMEEHTPEVEEQVGMDIGGGYDEDLADVASSTFEREKGLALESSVQHMLTQVEEALQRIEDGTYGICVRCGNPIDLARLRVLPYATLCIRCKELEERNPNSR